jgi:hypothetical protein
MKLYRAAGVLFFVLLFRFVADIPNHPERNGAVRGKEFVDILIVAVTVIVVAIPGKNMHRTAESCHHTDHFL